MNYYKIFSSHFINNLSLYFFVFLLIFTIDRHHRYEASTHPEKYGPFESDVAEYYSFIPITIYNDKDSVDENFKKNKRTIGMAIMYSPAFAVGHLIAHFTKSQKNGYSWPYKWCIRWWSIIFCIIGLFFCRKNLLLFFNDKITAITLICIFFGTNLFYYTYGTGEMPHSYLFTLYSAFIYVSLQLVLNNKIKYLLWLGLIGGLITLIRPTDAVIILFPLLYKVTSINSFKTRIKLFFTNKYIIVFSIILFFIPLLPQAIIWKKYHDTFIYYSYTDERFFFNDPQILNFLFSYQKGWLLYTPIMIFSIIGIFLSKKFLPDLFLFLFLFNIINVYILSCWFDWAFGGSFGCRVLIQSYSIFIFPLALSISWFYDLFKNIKIMNLISKTIITTLLILLIQLNLFQTNQYKYLIIHWSGMNKKIYNYIFLNDNISREELIYLHSLATPLDYTKLKKGERGLPL